MLDRDTVLTICGISILVGIALLFIGIAAGIAVRTKTDLLGKIVIICLWSGYTIIIGAFCSFQAIKHMRCGH